MPECPPAQKSSAALHGALKFPSSEGVAPLPEMVSVLPSTDQLVSPVQEMTVSVSTTFEYWAVTGPSVSTPEMTQVSKAAIGFVSPSA